MRPTYRSTSVRMPASGERALESSPVERAAMRLEQVLDRQLEQGAQPLDDLLPRQTLRLEPALVDLGAVAEVGEGVACDDGALALDPEHKVVPLVPEERRDPFRRPLAVRVDARLAEPFL